MKKHHFFLFFASQSLSKDSQTCWWKTLGGRLDKVVPLGKWSTRAVYHTCSFPVGQANFLLSWGWGITTKHKDYQCPIIRIILFPSFSRHVDWSKLGECCNNYDRSWMLAGTKVPHLKSVNWQEFGSNILFPLWRNEFQCVTLFHLGVPCFHPPVCLKPQQLEANKNLQLWIHKDTRWWRQRNPCGYQWFLRKDVLDEGMSSDWHISREWVLIMMNRFHNLNVIAAWAVGCVGLFSGRTHTWIHDFWKIW